MATPGTLERLVLALERIANSLERLEHVLADHKRPFAGTDGEATQKVKHPLSTVINNMERLPATVATFSDSTHKVAFSPEEQLRDWLAQRELVLQNTTIVPPDEEPWDWFAYFLGERFSVLRPFYEQWKRALHLRQTFVLHLQDAPPRQISDITQFALKLKEASLVVSFQYTKATRTLRVTPALSPDIINFVTGGWLERYIGRLLWQTASHIGLQPHRFVVFRNIQIVLPNAQQTELDLLALYQGQALWLESKTGDYSASVERWKQNNFYLKLPPTHAGIVLLEPLSTTAQQMLEQRTGMQVLSLNDLPTFLNNAMRAWVEAEESLPV